MEIYADAAEGGVVKWRYPEYGLQQHHHRDLRVEKSIEWFHLNKLNHTGKESGQKFTEQLEEELSLSLVHFRSII